MAGLLNWEDPQNAGLLGLASGLLQAGGPTQRPMSLGQGLAGGLLTSFELQQAAREANRRTSFVDAQTQAVLLANTQAERSQKALEELAGQMPGAQANMLLANPAAYIKSMTEGFTLSPGQTRFQGGGKPAVSLPNELKWVDTGSHNLGVDPASGQPRYAIPKSLTPGDAANLDWKKYEWANLSANERQTLANQAQGLALAGANYQYSTGQQPPIAPAVPGPAQVPGQPPQLPGMGVPGMAPPQGPASVLPGMPSQGQMTPPVRPPIAPPPVAAAPGAPVVPPDVANLPPKIRDEILQKRATERPRDLQGLQATLAKADLAIESAEKVMKHPGLALATGGTAWMSRLPGSTAYDASAKLETLKSEVMLSQLEALRQGSQNGSSGMGQLNQTEGDTLRNYIANLDKAQSAPAIRESLQKIIDFNKEMKERLVKGFEDQYGEKPQLSPARGMDWVDRAMRANPRLTREQVISEGKKRGKIE